MDGTQLERLKALFDEFGVDHVVYEGPNPEPGRWGLKFRVPDGMKFLVTGEGEGYSSFYACFEFTTEGRFLRYRIAE
jgi:hypothetical protein